MANRLLQSFLVGLGYDYDDKDLKEFEADVEKVQGAIKKMVGAAAAGATALTAMVVASTAASDEQGKLAGELNTTVGQIDALTFALERSGGTSDGMVSSLRGISRRASEAARGIGEGVEAFGLLGVQVTDSNGRLKQSDELLAEVSNKMQGLEAGRQIELAEKLGISGSIRLLQHGNDEIQTLIARAKALGTTTEEDAEIAAEFQDSLTDLWRVIKQVARVITRELAPIMTDMVNRFNDWWIANRQLIEQNIAGFFDKAAKAAKVFVAVLPFIAGAAALSAMSKVLAFLKLATIRTAALTLITAAWPLAMLAAKAGILIAIEDIFAFIDGKDSFLGEIIGKYPEYEPILLAVANYFELIRSLVFKALGGWKQIIEIARNFSPKKLVDVVKNTPGFAKFLAEKAGDSLKLAGSGFLDATGLRTFEEQGVIQPLNPAVAGASNSTISTTNIGDVNINISGATSPEDTAREVNQAFQDLQNNVDQ